MKTLWFVISIVIVLHACGGRHPEHVHTGRHVSSPLDGPERIRLSSRLWIRDRYWFYEVGADLRTGRWDLRASSHSLYTRRVYDDALARHDLEMVGHVDPAAVLQAVRSVDALRMGAQRGWQKWAPSQTGGPLVIALRGEEIPGFWNDRSSAAQRLLALLGVSSESRRRLIESRCEGVHARFSSGQAEILNVKQLGPDYHAEAEDCLARWTTEYYRLSKPRPVLDVGRWTLYMKPTRARIGDPRLMQP